MESQKTTGTLFTLCSAGDHPYSIVFRAMISHADQSFKISRTIEIEK